MMLNRPSASCGALFICLLACLTFTQAADRLNCPAPLPCVCTQFIIDCEAKNLTTVPMFQSTKENYKILLLANNSISALTAGVFNNLNVTRIYLGNNQLSSPSIAGTAFSGLENTLEVLDLNNNNIKPLPNAISNLNKLKDLDVSGNPMNGEVSVGHRHSDDFTASVMRSIGDSLIRFRFGHKTYMRSWPGSLDHLPQLQELVVSGSAVTFLHSQAFHGFERTLKNLTIEYASMASIPIAISFLTSLEELHMDHMLEPFDDSSMIQAPFAQLQGTLKSLSLDYDRLTVFPEVIRDLGSLNELSLDGNDLQFISDEAISLLKTANVSSLSLRDCNLQRVPGAISDLTSLKTLDLSDNKIGSIETTDLQNLGTMTKLSLAMNPLQYISDNSLCGLNNLETLDLYNTKLTDISQAVRNLPKLAKLDVRDSNIDCTCDMWWMKQWQDNCKDIPLEIEGKCETIYTDIQSYIVNRLITCPDYVHQHFACKGTCNS